MYVIYVEKKSAAMSIAKALGAGQMIKKKDLTQNKLGILGYWLFDWKGIKTYIIFGVGHLTKLYDAKDYDKKYSEWNLDIFPCIPNHFKTKPSEKTIEFYKLASDLFNKADLIISATDSDREGQVVFDYLYKTTGTKTPWMRAWLPSDLTDNKIRQAFNNLEHWSVRYPLTLAGIARSISDWTIGCNLTVASTIKYGGKTLMNEGRVQTAVLNMVATRTRGIENFVSSPFWKVSAEIFLSQDISFVANLVEPDKFENVNDAQNYIDNCNKSADAIVVDKKYTKRKIKKPLLYSTTDLQIAVNKKYGYDVTSIAANMEALYNMHFISYPRTDAVVLSNALEQETRAVIKKLFNTTDYNQYNRDESEWSHFTKRHFDDALIAKAGDSHTAVVPTLEIPDLSKLSEEQRNIYDMIARSVMCLAYDDVEVDDTTLIFDIAGYKFKAKGSVVTNYGSSWHMLYKDKIDNNLPDVIINDRLLFNPILTEGKTKPKPYYTQASLLDEMVCVNNIIDDEDIAAFMKAKECGLGTGGTRPSIIGGLLKNNLLKIEKKHIVPTEKGYWLIDHIPDELRMIKDPATTGRWEQVLNRIASSDLNTAKQLTAQFLKTINEATRKYYQAIVNSPTELFSETEAGKKLDGSNYKCPKCGMPLHRFNWGFGCSGYKNGCNFALGKFRDKKLTEKQMIDLLEKGKTDKITFKSKEGNSYQGYLNFNSYNDIDFTLAKSNKKKEG